MFAKPIRSTPLTSDNVDGLFNIAAWDTYQSDSSFLATLRALLYSRTDDSVWFKPCPVFEYFTTEDIGNHADLFGNLLHHITTVRTLLFAWPGTDLATTQEILKAFDASDGFCTLFHDWRELQDLKLFVKTRAGIDARFYVNDVEKSAIVFAGSCNLRSYHFLESLVPRLLPWYFNEHPLKPEEMELLVSLTKRSSADYERLIASMVPALDLRSQVIKKTLGDFEKAGRRAELKSTEDEINRLRADLNRITENYRNTVDRLDRLNIVFTGQRIALESAGESSELVDFFVCNKNLTPVTVAGRTLYFTVKGHLDSFDPELFDTYIKNTATAFYRGYDYRPAFADMTTRRRFLEAIFGEDACLKVNICSNYSLNLNGACGCQSSYRYDPAEYGNCIPNPHIQQFACLGNYRPLIEERLRAGDVVGAITQCIASAQSVNLAETPTVRALMQDLFGTTRPVIHLPDGRDVSPEQALQYLNEREGIS